MLEGLAVLFVVDFGARIPVFVFPNDLAASMALSVVPRLAAARAFGPGAPPVPLSVVPLERVFPVYPVMGLSFGLAAPLEPLAAAPVPGLPLLDDPPAAPPAWANASVELTAKA